MKLNYCVRQPSSSSYLYQPFFLHALKVLSIFLTQYTSSWFSVLCSVCALKITVVHTQAWLCKWETTIVARTDFQPINTLLEGGGQELFF